MSEAISKQQSNDFYKSLESNIQIIKGILGGNADFVQRDFIFEEKEIKGVCFYTDGLTNTKQIENAINTFLHEENKGSTSNFFENLKKKVLINPSVKEICKVDAAVQAILEGDSIFLFDGLDKAILVASKGWEARAVDEPQTEQVVRGPRDGFTESLRTNTSLVRRRIRSPLFKLEEMKIGEKSKTDINIAYLEGTVKEGLVDEVKKRLKSIKIDAVLESGYIEELIEDAPYSPFITVQSTERPDKVAAAIFEGRVAIFVDNTPFVLIVPTYFWQFLQASDDYYSKYLTGSFFRLIRYAAFVISLTLPSLYVMLVSFHQEMIPTTLALTIASGREVVPFPVLLEALLMEFAFELMREAGLRMPKPVGQAVSIVGSLIIGQAAVQAGVVSPFMVIIVAITGISSFAIPNYSASYSIRLLRFPLLIASGMLGLLGFAVMLAILIIHGLTIRSFGEAYFSPATPFQPSDQKDVIVRFPWWGMKRQPALAEGSEERIGENQIPKPEENKPSSTPKDDKKPVDKGKEKNKSKSNGNGQSKVRRIPKKDWMKKDE